MNRGVEISSHGCEWAAKNMAGHLKTLGARFSKKAEPCELKIMVGWYFMNGGALMRREMEAAKKRVVWYVGTDILWLEQAGKNSAEVRWLLENVHEHWAEWEPSRQRLERLGIPARVVHMPTRRLYKPLPLPREFAVGVYCYNSRQDFYGWNLVKKAAQLTPDVLWKIYPRYSNCRNGNIEEIKRVAPNDMEMLYEQISVHARIVASDGMPQGPMEAAMCGRPVIYNHQPMPHVMWFPQITPETLAERVLKIRDLQAEGAGYNYEGSLFWKEANDPSRLINEVLNVNAR